MVVKISEYLQTGEAHRVLVKNKSTSPDDWAILGHRYANNIQGFNIALNEGNEEALFRVYDHAGAEIGRMTLGDDGIYLAVPSGENGYVIHEGNIGKYQAYYNAWVFETSQTIVIAEAGIYYDLNTTFDGQLSKFFDFTDDLTYIGKYPQSFKIANNVYGNGDENSIYRMKAFLNGVEISNSTARSLVLNTTGGGDKPVGLIDEFIIVDLKKNDVISYKIMCETDNDSFELTGREYLITRA